MTHHLILNHKRHICISKQPSIISKQTTAQLQDADKFVCFSVRHEALSVSGWWNAASLSAGLSINSRTSHAACLNRQNVQSWLLICFMFSPLCQKSPDLGTWLQTTYSASSSPLKLLQRHLSLFFRARLSTFSFSSPPLFFSHINSSCSSLNSKLSSSPSSATD